MYATLWLELTFSVLHYVVQYALELLYPWVDNGFFLQSVVFTCPQPLPRSAQNGMTCSKLYYNTSDCTGLL